MNYNAIMSPRAIKSMLRNEHVFTAHFLPRIIDAIIDADTKFMIYSDEISEIFKHYGMQEVDALMQRIEDSGYWGKATIDMWGNWEIKLSNPYHEQGLKQPVGHKNILSPAQIENLLNGDAYWFYAHLLHRIIEAMNNGDKDFLMNPIEVEDAFACYTEEELDGCLNQLEESGFNAERVDNKIRISWSNR